MTNNAESSSLHIYKLYINNKTEPPPVTSPQSDEENVEAAEGKTKKRTREEDECEESERRYKEEMQKCREQMKEIQWERLKWKRKLANKRDKERRRANETKRERDAGLFFQWTRLTRVYFPSLLFSLQVQVGTSSCLLRFRVLMGKGQIRR